jgi:stage V sporulation protein G
MIISECRVKLWNSEPVRAIASITFDNQFVIKGIRILNVRDRFIVCMPSRRGLDGVHRDVAHPINSATRDRIDQFVLEAYNRELDRCRAGETAMDGRESDDFDPGEDRAETGAWAR